MLFRSKITYKLSASQMWLIDISIIVDNWIRKMSQDGFLEELNVEGGCFSQYDHVLKAIERLEETSLWLNRAIKKSHE